MHGQKYQSKSCVNSTFVNSVYLWWTSIEIRYFVLKSHKLHTTSYIHFCFQKMFSLEPYKVQWHFQSNTIYFVYQIWKHQLPWFSIASSSCHHIKYILASKNLKYFYYKQFLFFCVISISRMFFKKSKLQKLQW